MTSSPNSNVSRVAVLRAEYFEDEWGEEYSTPSGIHPLDVRLVGVYTGARDRAVTVTLNRAVGDPYGVEFDVSSANARLLAKKLMTAAMSIDMGEEDQEF